MMVAGTTVWKKGGAVNGMGDRRHTQHGPQRDRLANYHYIVIDG
jgi:hypothetical protein